MNMNVLIAMGVASLVLSVSMGIVKAIVTVLVASIPIWFFYRLFRDSGDGIDPDSTDYMGPGDGGE